MFGAIGCPILTKTSLPAIRASNFLFLLVGGEITISISMFIMYKIKNKYVGTYDHTNKVKRVQL